MVQAAQNANIQKMVIRAAGRRFGWFKTRRDSYLRKMIQKKYPLLESARITAIIEATRVTKLKERDFSRNVKIFGLNLGRLILYSASAWGIIQAAMQLHSQGSITAETKLALVVCVGFIAIGKAVRYFAAALKTQKESLLENLAKMRANLYFAIGCVPLAIAGCTQLVMLGLVFAFVALYGAYTAFKQEKEAKQKAQAIAAAE